MHLFGEEGRKLCKYDEMVKGRVEENGGKRQRIMKNRGYKERETIKYGKYPNASNTGFD